MIEIRSRCGGVVIYTARTDTLSGADLRGADLRDASLSGADLSGADLRGASLFRADLSGADLSGANLSGANLRDAYLRGAFLFSADLSGADLRDADLRDVSLSGADLHGAKLSPFQIVPQEGEFYCYKKVRFGQGEAVLTLRIPATAARTSSLVGRKCRASVAKVVKAETLDGTPITGAAAVFRSRHESEFTYRVGKTVSVSDFDPDIRVECAKGVHFFITKQEAINY